MENGLSSGIGASARNEWSVGNNSTEATRLNGFYVGQVMDDTDYQYMGRVWVYIPEYSNNRMDIGSVPTGGTTDDRKLSDKQKFDQKLRNGWIMVSPMTPFAGSDGFSNPASTHGDEISYGMTAQARIGDFVGVMFSAGDPNSGYYIGMIPKSGRNGMVPGIPGTTAATVSAREDIQILKEVHPAALIPTQDRIPSDGDPRGEDRRAMSELTRNIARAGISGDIQRGAGTSGARRESPSYVTGIKTPGFRYDTEKDNNDTDGKPFKNRVSELSGVNTSGHQFVMDDHPDHQSVRMRTSSGSQILLNDAGTPYIYIQTASGDAWVEIADTGDIHIYAGGDVNIHSEGDYNLTVDGDMNLEVGGNFRQKIAGDYETEVEGFTQRAYGGSMVTNVKEEYDLNIGDNARIMYNGDFDKRIAGNTNILRQGNARIRCNGSAERLYDGDIYELVIGDYQSMIIGSMGIKSNLNMSLVSDGIFSASSIGDMTLGATDNIFMSAKNKLDIKLGDAFSLETGGITSIKSGGNINIDGTTINFQGGLSNSAAVLKVLPAIIPTLNDYNAPDVAAQPILSDKNLTHNKPTDKEAIGNTTPNIHESVASVVPQHQPWVNRTGVGNTKGMNGNVNSSPITGAVTPRSVNIACVKNTGKTSSDILNFRNGASFLSSLLPNNIIGAVESGIGQITSFFAAAPYNTKDQGEPPVPRQIRVATALDTGLPTDFSISTAMKGYIKRQTGFSLNPVKDILGKKINIGFGSSMVSGSIFGNLNISSDIFKQINSLSSTVNKEIAIVKSDAIAAFDTELTKVETWVKSKFPKIEFTQHQYDAVVSFAHNVGITKLESDIHGKSFVSALQIGDFSTAVNAMNKFVHIGGNTNCNLVERRRMEGNKLGQLPNRDRKIGVMQTYTPSGKTVKIAKSLNIEEDVFNALCKGVSKSPLLPDGYLFATAAAESGFIPWNQASTSGAGGLFQFIPSTGVHYGIPPQRKKTAAEAKLVSTGDYPVYDPYINTDAAVEFTMENYRTLVANGVSNPSGGDLYLAHFMGATGASRFTIAKAKNPNGYPALTSTFKSAAAANTTIFYNHGKIDSPRTYTEVYNTLVNKITSRMPKFVGACSKGIVTPDPHVTNAVAKPDPSTLSQKQLDAHKDITNYPNSGLWIPATYAGLHESSITWHSYGRHYPTFYAPAPFDQNMSEVTRIAELSAKEAGITDLYFTTAYRDKDFNKAVTGKPGSYHQVGAAIDINLPHMKTSLMLTYLDRLLANGITGIGIGSWGFHVDIRHTLLNEGIGVTLSNGNVGKAGSKVWWPYDIYKYAIPTLKAHGFL